ncbi:LuxR C-terminal-related transcriptional regulator [uncultured Eudoraea sp.]|uniref:LuxR C-terminal-related transcriptional regulator n=1 Tax=uncultured Eudoraea sp. TaxID=1035614 RepID=UPI002606285C|nr:LuxR C-terminal-related transcriptional regulator [uncultured Eudoraea sp.]
MSKAIKDNIIRTKLHRPPVSDDILLRTSLIEELEKNRFKPLTLVVAPAGYGKSLIISEWIEDQKLVNAWISLDGEINNLPIFLEYLCAALITIFPPKKQEFCSMTKAAVLPSLNILTTTLLNEIDDLENEFVLVLDDYQFVKDDQIHEFINAILKYPPQNMHLVIISRRDPPLKLSTFRAYNRISEIRMKQLAFSKNDIHLLFQKSFGQALSDKTAELLFERTEGWIVGLRLAILSVNNVEEANNLLANFRGDTFEVSEFILAEILNKESEEIQNLLIISSLFDRFCAELLDEVLPDLLNNDHAIKNGQEFIDRLLKTNLFVIPLDAEHKWFRYHHFFQELLQGEFKKRKCINNIDRFHILVCQWFEKNLFILEAVKYAATIKDYELAADILERQKNYLYNLDDWQSLESLLACIPPEIVEQRLPLILTKIMIISGRFDLEGMKSYLDKCETLLGDPPREDEHYGEWCYHKGFMTSYIQEDQTEVIKYYTKAIEFLPREPMGMIRAEAELQIEVSRHMTGQGTKALSNINNRLSQYYPKQGILWERLMFGLSLIHLLDGRLSYAYREALVLNEYTKKNDLLYVETWSSSILGVVALHKLELNKSEEFFKRVVKLQYLAFDRVAADCIAGLAITYHFQREFEKSLETLKILFDYASRTNNPEHLHLLNAFEARLNLLSGKNSEALNWLRTFEMPVQISSMIYFFTNPVVTACRVSLALGSKDEIKKTVEQLEELHTGTKKLNYKCQSIDIRILLALGYEKSGRKEKALATLRKVIKTTALNDWIRPYVEAGPIIISLLSELQLIEPLADELNHVQAIKKAYLAINEEVEPDGIVLETNAGKKEGDLPLASNPVSHREHEIIKLVSKGFRNKEIAADLYISENTVKKHLYNIYQKFEINNRTSLVDIFKKLEISKES